MPRIRLKPLAGYPFKIPIRVRVTDLNYGGHLGNDSLLSLVHEARVAFLKSRGYSELDFGGVSLILSDAVINYQGEAFAGDVLEFEVAAGEPSSIGFRLFFRVTRVRDRAAIALVENGLVCFDYDARAIRELPPSARSVLD